MWKDFKWVEKRFGTKFANILKGFDKGSKEIEEHFTTKENHEVTFTDANGVQNTLVTEQGISEVLAKNGLIEVTWQELKDKRDNGQLIPGSLYRIIDYNCTTTQENTRSAGHQFDIVLLALSENKLAEEGWAMMSESNIYDVTFADGVTKKCWVYIENINDGYNIVTVDSLLGISGIVDGDWVVNKDTKSITMNELSSADIVEENLPYNYFQNSNLSSWKVWYCLDNDTSRFAWADNRLILHEIIISGSPQDYIRTPESDLTIDGVKYYAWVWSSSPEFTLSETPKHGDALYKNFGGMVEIGECDKVFTNGRGVIYRLIDEFNNDVAYDFKNIQYIRPLNSNGLYDAGGTNTWVYTFNTYNKETEDIIDTTMYRYDGEDSTLPRINIDNKISNQQDTGRLVLTNNVFLQELYEDADILPTTSYCICEDSKNNTIMAYHGIKLSGSSGCVISATATMKNIYLISCTNKTLTTVNYKGTIYLHNKAVLTES